MNLYLNFPLRHLHFMDSRNFHLGKQQNKPIHRNLLKIGLGM